TLGGGVGWLMRKHGLTVDNLLAVDVVTADGELLRASEDEHPDLFWALRGGGGNFGVVTSFEFRLHSVAPAVLAGPILWDATDAGEVLRFYRDFVRDAPDELGTVVRFGTAPPLAVIPEDLHWRPVVMVGTCYAGPMEDGEQVLRPLRASRTPLLDLVGPTPYVGFQSALDSTVVHGWNYYWKSTQRRCAGGRSGRSLRSHHGARPRPSQLRLFVQPLSRSVGIYHLVARHRIDEGALSRAGIPQVECRAGVLLRAP